MSTDACNGHGRRTDPQHGRGSPQIPSIAFGKHGAGGRNRTDETCLEGRSFATKLRPGGAGADSFSALGLRSSPQNAFEISPFEFGKLFLTGFLPCLALRASPVCRFLGVMALLTQAAPAPLHAGRPAAQKKATNVKAAQALAKQKALE